MKIKILAVAVMSAVLAGCVNQGPTYSPDELALIRDSMQQSTLSIDCPAGCKVAYKDPRDTIKLPQKTNGYDAVIAVAGSVERIVGSAIVPAALVYQGVKAFDALEDRQDVVTTTTTTNTNEEYTEANTTHTVGDNSGDNSGVSGHVGDSVVDTDTTTSTTDNSDNSRVTEGAIQ